MKNGENANNMAAIEDQAQYQLAQLQNSVLKSHTLMPGEWHGGVIVFDGPEKDDKGSAEYEIAAKFDGEEYSFSVGQQARK